MLGESHGYDHLCNTCFGSISDNLEQVNDLYICLPQIENSSFLDYHGWSYIKLCFQEDSYVYLVRYHEDTEVQQYFLVIPVAPLVST